MIEVERVNVSYNLAQVDPMHALVVLTSPRPVGYLERTLQSLERAGSARWPGPKLIVADGCTPNVPGWRIESTEERRGFKYQFCKNLLRVIDDGFSAMTFFPDDVALAKNALDYISSVVFPPGAGFLSWIALAERLEPKSREKSPFFETRPLSDWGNCVGCTIRRDVIDRTLKSDVFETSVYYLGERLFGRALPGDEDKVAVHFPNIVEHMGDVSSFGSHQEIRRSIWFTGEDFDCLSWVKT